MSKKQYNKSNFVNNSSNFCETNVLKSKILRPILEQYNDAILSNEETSSILNFTNESCYIIPNNNIKYYLLIVNKNSITSDNCNYKIMYFFPESITNINTDYYSEIDNFKNTSGKSVFLKNVYLFEGYMYNLCNFLITDVLYIDGVINTNYSTRKILLNEIFFGNLPHVFNGNIKLDIHPTFKESQSSESLFKKYFVHASELNSTEYINDKKLIKVQKWTPENTTELEKILKKEDGLSDVYYVYNIITNDKEGIAYIKTLYESCKMRDLITTGSVVVKCDFNQRFKKWHPILE
jgi:hypothetical protein